MPLSLNEAILNLIKGIWDQVQISECKIIALNNRLRTIANWKGEANHVWTIRNKQLNLFYSITEC